MKSSASCRMSAKTVCTNRRPASCTGRRCLHISESAPDRRPFAGSPTSSAATRPVTEAFLSQLQQAVWSVNSSLPVSPRTMRDVYARSLARTSFTLVMLAIAASMALLLGVVGIYGVIAYAVSQRRREIGIRAALGAQQGELKGMFVRHGLVLAGIGVVIGLGAAAGLTRLMSSLLYGITPLDPVTYVAVPLVLVAATVLASYVPARRAASVDPVEALRVE